MFRVDRTQINAHEVNDAIVSPLTKLSVQLLSRGYDLLLRPRCAQTNTTADNVDCELLNTRYNLLFGSVECTNRPDKMIRRTTCCFFYHPHHARQNIAHLNAVKVSPGI